MGLKIVDDDDQPPPAVTGEHQRLGPGPERSLTKGGESDAMAMPELGHWKKIRITAWLRLGGASGGRLVQASCSSRATKGRLLSRGIGAKGFGDSSLEQHLMDASEEK